VLYSLYRKRIAAFLVAPPAEDWDGSFALGKAEPAPA
jgi:hypothetical protein